MGNKYSDYDKRKALYDQIIRDASPRCRDERMSRKEVSREIKSLIDIAQLFSYSAPSQASYVAMSHIVSALRLYGARKGWTAEETCHNYINGEFSISVDNAEYVVIIERTSGGGE